MAHSQNDSRQFISVSRLQKFDKCAQAYNLHYNHQLYLGETSDSLMLGTIVHEALESFYRREITHPVEYLDTFWNQLFETHELQHVALAIENYKKDMEHLLWRCSESCTDKGQQIRNKDGSCPSPRAIGPGSKNQKIAAAWNEQQFEQRMAYVDKQVSRIKGWQNVSASTIYSRAYELLSEYREIPGLTEVLAVEMGFSEKVLDANGKKVTMPDGTLAVRNPVTLPKSGDYFTGKVDLVALVDGAVAIIDHKTSRGDPPAGVAVAYHDQLLMYAWAYEQIFKERPYYIAINHLRSGQIVLMPINWDMVEEAVERFDTKALSTRTDHFGKRAPFEYNSPCLDGAKDLSDVTQHCPYLHVCYPQLYSMLPGVAEALAAEAVQAELGDAIVIEAEVVSATTVVESKPF